MTAHNTTSAKTALIEAAKKHGQIDPLGPFGQEEALAKRLAIFGLIEMLGKDSAMADLLKSYQTFATLSFPVMLDEEKCDWMDAAIEDFRASAEAMADQMLEELCEIKRDMGLEV